MFQPGRDIVLKAVVFVSLHRKRLKPLFILLLTHDGVCFPFLYELLTLYLVFGLFVFLRSPAVSLGFTTFG